MSKVIYLPKPITLKAYNKKELATALGISTYILNKWLYAIQDQLGEPIGGVYSPRQVQLIIEAYWLPGQILNDAIQIIDNAA